VAPSRTTGTSICLELTTGEQYLVVDIAIDCPACGSHTVRFAGHHLQAIRQFLTETIDQYPELTLKNGDLAVVERLAFQGPGNDPGSN
jgi:hypothetical protein